MELKILDFGLKTQNDENDFNNINVTDRNKRDEIIRLNWPKKIGTNEFSKSETQTIERK